MLYLVATPIGNLSDITFRAIETLRSCDLILCEDTRHSLTLLKHYEIAAPLKSYHRFNEAKIEESLLEALRQDKKIALISDAGTPGISDPGTKLVKACIEEGIQVEAIPGPCAAIQALSCSGLDTDRFQFVGFLPRKAGELDQVLEEFLAYAGTTICYESPNRLVNILERLEHLAPTRSLVVARELTKKFEELRRGTASELLAHFNAHPLKGEIVLLISGAALAAPSHEETTLRKHVAMLETEYGLSHSDAAKAVATICGVSKRKIY